MPPWVRALVLYAPFLLTFVFAVVLVIPTTRDFAKDQLAENSPVELLTALLLAIGAVIAVRIVRSSRRVPSPPYVSAFFALAGLGLFLIAMEEIAWGQWLFGFDTPDGIEELNEQDELTLHNLRGVHGRTEFLRLAYGIGGMVGIGLSGRAAFRGMTPSPFLLGWFVVITGLAVPDLVYDFVDLGSNVGGFFDNLSELTELFVAGASLLFLWECERYWSGSDREPGPLRHLGQSSQRLT